MIIENERSWLTLLAPWSVIMDSEQLSAEHVLDIRGALARLDGDSELLAELIGFYLEDSERMLAELRSAVAASDANEIKMAAHALKGLVAGCGGVRAAEAARRVEHAGAANDLTHIDGLVQNLKDELELVSQQARGYIM
jgi:HPt (histidine-containing phosphotransfer) domain-containing protein